MLIAFLLVLAGAVLIGVGLVCYARRRRTTALPPIGLDIPKREELPFLLKLCIAAKISNMETEADKKFLSGVAYWKCIDEGMKPIEALGYAMQAQDAVLDIRIIKDGE